MATRLMRLARPLSHLRPSHSSIPSRQQILPTRSASTFNSGPSPPRLPPEEQAEFERLQRTANTQEGFNATSSPDFSTPAQSQPATRLSPSKDANTPETTSEDDVDAELNGAPTPLRKGAPPEFEGDVNPRTGEVGGPKNEPLRWGAGGDYSFNGRVTDF